jgi:colanic acid biosynthesis glycosyl transferase WcaI
LAIDAGANANPAASRILLQTLVFPPDGVSTADILGRLMRELQRLGHAVTVVTTTPHYNLDPAARAAQPLRGGNPLWRRSDYEGIDVFHVRVPAERRGFAGRSLGHLWFHAVTLVLSLRLRRRFDLLLVVSPPPSAGFVGALTAAVLRIPFLYNVQEMFPDALEHLGVIRARGMVVRLLAWGERFAYARASMIIAVSSNFVARLQQRGVAHDRLRVIANFADVERVRPLPRDDIAFARDLGIAATFNVLYAGNLGLAQDWETVLEAADRLRDRLDVRFVLIGGGVEAARIRALIAQRSLDNVLLLPYQAAGQVAAIYACSDLALVPMRPQLDFDTLPSKIYSIMASGRAALVCADPESEVAQLVERAGCGIVVPQSEGAAALANAIESAMTDRPALAAMGARGREYVARAFSPGAIAAEYHTVIQEVAHRSAHGRRERVSA